MEINGLPAHPLLVHAAVVLIPLVAVAAVLVSVWPAARARIGFLVPIGAVACLALVPLVTRAGESLAENFGAVPAITHHHELGERVLPWVAGLAVTTVADWLAQRRGLSGVWRYVLMAAVAIAAVGSVVVVVAAGDSGARAVWGG